MKRSVLAFLAMLVGCRQRECPPEEPRPRSEPTMRAALARVAQAGEVNVLVLSGGGSRGAFGAGILKGLGKAGKRPRYNVVTGVSTGALLATSAFLGDDATLERLYAGGVTTADILRKRCILTLPFSSSLTTLGPLEALIEREITDELIDKVGAEAMRSIFVATTNMDRGLLRVWNMGDIARRHEYALYRRVLLASSSVPFMHPPVYIDGVHHADGGVREVLLLRAVMLGLQGARVTIHVVLNGKLNVDEMCVQPGLLSIATRAVEVLATASAVGTLYQSHATAQSVGARWLLARIPDSLPLGFDAMTFDPVGMKALFDYGVATGETENWETGPPLVSDSARVINTTGMEE